MTVRWANRWLLSVVLTVPVLSACGNGESVQPTPTEIRLFLGANDYSQLQSRSLVYIYQYDSLQLLDSIPLPAISLDAAVSKDGNSLFATTTRTKLDRTISRFDLTTKGLVWRREIDPWVPSPDGLGRLRLLNDGDWLLLNRTVLAASDGTTIATLPEHWLPLGGPSTGTRIAIGIVPSGQSTPSTLIGHDLASDTSWGTYAPQLLSGDPLLAVYTAALHADMRRVLAIGIRNVIGDSWFVVGDLRTGATLMQHELTYPFGEIEMSPDGQLAGVSDPSWTGISDSRPTLDMFDLERNQHLHRLVAGEGLPIRPGQLVWLPGSSSIVVAPRGDGSSAGPVFSLDVQSLEISHLFWLPGRSEEFEYIIGALAAGSAETSR